MIIINQYQSKFILRIIANITKTEEKKIKKLSVKQCLYKIMSYLSDLMNDNKANRNNSDEWKIQINMHVIFISSNDKGETHTIFV